MEKQPKEIVAIIAEKPGATFASVSADSKTLAVAHPSGTIRGWDLTGKEPKLIFALKRGESRIQFVALSADGKRLASTCMPFHDKKSKESGLMVWTLSEKEPKRVDLPSIPLPWSVPVFSPKRNVLASFTAIPHAVQGFVFLDVSQNRPKFVGSISGPTGQVRFAPDGKTVAIADSRGGVALYEWATDTEGPTIRIESEDQIASFAFGHDSKTLALQKNGLIEIWDVSAAKPKRARFFQTGEGGYWIDFAPDGKSVASTNVTKKTVSVHTVAGKKVYEWGFSDIPVNVVFTSDSRHLVVTCGNVYIFRIER
jgi:WD40 repeat protein